MALSKLDAFLKVIIPREKWRQPVQPVPRAGRNPLYPSGFYGDQPLLGAPRYHVAWFPQEDDPPVRPQSAPPVFDTRIIGDINLPESCQSPERGFSIHGNDYDTASTIGEGILNAQSDGRDLDELVTDGLDRHGLPIPWNPRRRAQSLPTASQAARIYRDDMRETHPGYISVRYQRAPSSKKRKANSPHPDDCARKPPPPPTRQLASDPLKTPMPQSPTHLEPLPPSDPITPTPPTSSRTGTVRSQRRSARTKPLSATTQHRLRQEHEIRKAASAEWIAATQDAPTSPKSPTMMKMLRRAGIKPPQNFTFNVDYIADQQSLPSPYIRAEVSTPRKAQIPAASQTHTTGRVATQRLISTQTLRPPVPPYDAPQQEPEIASPPPLDPAYESEKRAWIEAWRKKTHEQTHRDPQQHGSSGQAANIERTQNSTPTNEVAMPRPRRPQDHMPAQFTNGFWRPHPHAPSQNAVQTERRAALAPPLGIRWKGTPYPTRSTRVLALDSEARRQGMQTETHGGPATASPRRPPLVKNLFLPPSVRVDASGKVLVATEDTRLTPSIPGSPVKARQTAQTTEPPMGPYEQTKPGGGPTWFTKPPTGGFPTRHRTDPYAQIINMAPDKIAQRQNAPSETTVVAEIALHHPPKPEAAWITIQRLNRLLEGVIGRKPSWVMPPELAAQPTYPHDRELRNRVPTGYTLGLPLAEDADWLVNVECLSTDDITVFFTRCDFPIPRLIASATGFGEGDLNDISEGVRNVFRRRDVWDQLAAMAIHDMNLPRGSTPNKDEVADAVQRIVNSIEVDTTILDSGRVVSNVYSDPLSENPDKVRAFKRFLLNIRIDVERNSSGHFRTLVHCDVCYGADHTTNQCTYPDILGWKGPIPKHHARKGPANLPPADDDNDHCTNGGLLTRGPPSKGPPSRGTPSRGLPPRGGGARRGNAQDARPRQYIDIGHTNSRAGSARNRYTEVQRPSGRGYGYNGSAGRGRRYGQGHEHEREQPYGREYGMENGYGYGYGHGYDYDWGM